MEHGFYIRSSGTSEKVVLFFQKEYSKRVLSRFILYLTQDSVQQWMPAKPTFRCGKNNPLFRRKNIYISKRQAGLNELRQTVLLKNLLKKTEDVHWFIKIKVCSFHCACRNLASQLPPAHVVGKDFPTEVDDHKEKNLKLEPPWFVPTSRNLNGS